MNISSKQDRQCHETLPIDPDEKVLAVYRHHILAYLIPILLAVTVIAVVVGLTMLMTSQTSLGAEPIIGERYQRQAFGIAIALSVATVIFTFIPVWLRLQEHIVLTDEAVLQVLQPGLFASKVSQTGLERIADVSVRQDFLGTIFGYGKLSIETPGEQDNYEYTYLPNARSAAREIIDAHENFAAALGGGHLPTTLGSANNAATYTAPQPSTVSVDAEAYQAFVKFQQQSQQPAPADSGESQPPTPSASA